MLPRILGGTMNKASIGTVSLAILGLVHVHASGAQALPAQATESNGAALQEVIVTAERRTEDVQKSALAIQVLTPDQLSNAGVVDAKSMALLVPGLQVGSGGPMTQIYIRGVGDFGSSSLSNPAVATNFDGVYIAREAGVAGLFYDLARVEVLKGPQGTLYGRNATGGAINIIPNDPSFSGFDGYADIEVGNYAEVVTDGALNAPLSEHLALRAAFQTVDHRGYLSDGTNDARDRSGRFEALWRDGGRLKVLLTTDYSHQGGKGNGYALRLAQSAPSSSPWLGITDPRANAAQLALAAAAGMCIPSSELNGLDAAPPPRGQLAPAPCDTGGAGPGTLLFSGLSQASFQDNTIWGAQAHIDLDLGWATLSLIPAYRSTVLNFIFYPTIELYDHPDTSGETTGEIRLVHSGSSLKWVAGLYYFNEDQSAFDDNPAGLFSYSEARELLGSRSYAAYGQATISVSRAFRLIGGLRVTRESKSLSGITLSEYPSLPYAPPAPGVPAQCPGTDPCPSESFAGNVAYNNLSWKGGAEYDLTASNMLYATAATGFKAGGLNDSAGTAVYEPERLLAFELGSHNRFLDNRLQVNLETFYWKYRDQQLPHIALDSLGNVAYITINAARARMYGYDLDVAAKATASDTVHAAVEYLDSRYGSFEYPLPSTDAVPPPIPGVTTGCSVTTVVDCSGFQALVAPLWSGTAGWTHRTSLRSGASITTDLDAEFSSPRWLAIDFLAPQERSPSYIVESASLQYAAASGHWSVTAFVRNLTNRPVYSIAFENPYVLGGAVASTIGDPRTYGARVSLQF
jgi:iron complex outermembrane receptor protein